MTGTGRGFALALAMLIGALSVTSLLALGLQGHAVQHQPSADFSPTKDALVDPAGWPREAQPEPQPESSSTPRVGQGRSRLPAASSDSGAELAAEAEIEQVGDRLELFRGKRR